MESTPLEFKVQSEELLSCFRQEIELARRITGELVAQQKALQELDLAGLDVFVSVLEGLHGELKVAEERRWAAARALAQRLQLPADVRLRELLVGIPGPVREELIQAHAEMKSLIEEIYHRNYANYVLMLNAACFNRVILQRLSGTAVTYARDGASGETGQAQALLLNKKI
jgi:hypothetical protein